MIGALASALLYVACFPPLGLDWLAWIALVPLLVAASRRAPRQAALVGLVFGTTAGTALAWWFPEMVAGFFALPLVAGWLALLVAALVFGGLPSAVFAAWVAWVTSRGRAGPLVIAAGWGACELGRARLGIGNPWALLGYSQVAHPLVMQIADASGPYGAGMLIAAVNALAASPALRPAHPWRAAGVVVGLVLATLGYGAHRLGQTFDEGPAFEVAAVQLGRGRAATAPLAERLTDVERYLALTRAPDDAPPADRPPALIVWPEHAVPFFLQEDDPRRTALLALTRAGSDLVVGGPSYVLSASEARERNSIFLLRDGRLAGRYDKRLLLPVAEDGAAPGMATPTYVAGERVHALRTGRGLVGGFLCFEAMYPDVVRRFADGGAVLLVNPSNDSWFRHAAAARHQLDIASVRAIENRRWLVRAATGGFSAVVDPYGRLVAVAGFGEPARLRAAVRVARSRTPYQRVGDLGAWLAVALALAAAVSPARHGPPRHGRRDGLSNGP